MREEGQKERGTVKVTMILCWVQRSIPATKTSFKESKKPHLGMQGIWLRAGSWSNRSWSCRKRSRSIPSIGRLRLNLWLPCSKWSHASPFRPSGDVMLPAASHKPCTISIIIM